MSTQNRDYFERRLRESLDAAANATDPAIIRIHREFAEHYARCVESEGPAACPVADAA